MRKNSEFVILSSAAKMPAGCWGEYRRVGLLEVRKGFKPKQISQHPKGVIRIIKTWEKLNVGKTNRCAFQKALEEAESLCAKMEHLNSSEWRNENE